MSISLSSSRIYGALLVTLAIAAVAGGLIITIHSQSSGVTNTAGTHANEDIRMTDMMKIAKFVEGNPETAEKIASAFRTATDTVAVIEEIEHTAASVPVAVVIDRADIAASDSGERTLSIAATASGNWNGLYRYISELDTFPFMHETTRISLIKPLEDGGEEWKASIEMNVPLMQQ